MTYLYQPAQINHHKVEIHQVDSTRELHRGLTNEQLLKLNQILLFRTSKNRINFFTTYSLKYPIDIVFIKNNRVVLVLEKLDPCLKASSQCPIYGGFIADLTLEMHSGYAQKLQIKLYQQVKIKW